MYMIAEVLQYVAVASFAEAWIEILYSIIYWSTATSPPSRRRGLKSVSSGGNVTIDDVASFAEAWIEIKTPACLARPTAVASFAEAWIEINILIQIEKGSVVASFAEAWIEILLPYCKY